MPDSPHLHVEGYRCQGNLPPPTQGAAYHPPAALMYILREVRVDGEHQATNADLAWPEPLRPRPHAQTPVWLVTTDHQCAQAAEQAQLLPEWVVVQVDAGHLRPRGLPQGTTLLGATAVPHDPHMAVHALEDQPEDTGHWWYISEGPSVAPEHLTALQSWASTVTGAGIRFQGHPATRSSDTLGLSVDQLAPGHPDAKWHSRPLNAGRLNLTGYYWVPEAWSHTSPDAWGGGPCRDANSVALVGDLASA